MTTYFGSSSQFHHLQQLHTQTRTSGPLEAHTHYTLKTCTVLHFRTLIYKCCSLLLADLLHAMLHILRVCCVLFKCCGFETQFRYARRQLRFLDSWSCPDYQNPSSDWLKVWSTYCGIYIRSNCEYEILLLTHCAREYSPNLQHHQVFFFVNMKSHCFPFGQQWFSMPCLSNVFLLVQT